MLFIGYGFFKNGVIGNAVLLDARQHGGMLERVGEQINERAKRRRIAPVAADQFLVTLVGSCLFPFVAQPMFAEALGLSATGVRQFMKRQRTELPALLKRTLK